MISVLLRDIKIYALLFLISLAIFVVDTTKTLDFPKSVIQSVTVPVQFGLYKTSQSFGRQVMVVFTARTAAQEKKAMTEQMATLLSENSQLRKQLAEVQSQLTQQSTLNPQEFNLAPARPIGISRYLSIDKGSEDGLKGGEAVIYKDNYLGKIKEVSPKKSKVMLSSDPDSKISAFSQSSDGKAKGVLNGLFGSELVLDKILHEEPIKKDDLVYTEGSEEEIPRGLVLGKVEEVMAKDNEVFKQAKVKPVFDIATLDLVFVVKN